MKTFVIWTSFLFLLFFLAQPNQANDTLLMITSDKEVKKVNSQLGSLITNSKSNNLDLLCELINTQFPTYLTEKSSSSTQDEMVLEEDLSRIPNMPTKMIGSALLHLVRSKKNSKLYTLIVLDKKEKENIFQYMNKNGVKQVVSNIYMINSIKSNHAVHLHNCFQTTTEILLLFSHTLYTTSNLALMMLEKKKNFEENFVQKVAYSLADMIDDFEENQISILHLTAENVQIDDKGNAFLADLSPCYYLHEPVTEPEHTKKGKYSPLVIILKRMLAGGFSDIDNFPGDLKAKKVLDSLLNVGKNKINKLKNLFEHEWPLNDSENQSDLSSQEGRIFKQVLIKKMEKWRKENPQKILTSINDLTTIQDLPNYFAAKDNVDIRTDGTKIYAVKTMDMAEIVENKLIGETNRLISEIIKLKSEYFAEVELLDVALRKIYLGFDLDSSVQVNKFFSYLLELKGRRLLNTDEYFFIGQSMYFSTVLATATKQLVNEKIFDLEINEFNVRLNLNGDLKIFPLAFQKREEINSNENEKEITNIYYAPIVSPQDTETNESLYSWSIGVFIYVWNHGRNPKIMWKKKNRKDECAISKEQIKLNLISNYYIPCSVNFDSETRKECYRRMLVHDDLDSIKRDSKRFILNNSLSLDPSTLFIDTQTFYTNEEGQSRFIDSFEFESELWALRQNFDNNINVDKIKFKNETKKYDKYCSIYYATTLDNTLLTVKAIKILEMKNDKIEDPYQKIYKELKCHSLLAADDNTLGHEYMAKLHGFDWTFGGVFLFFEATIDLKNFALHMRTNKNDKRTFEELKAGQFLVGMVQAVQFAHAKKIVLHDLKLDHFWMDFDGSNIKLADLSNCQTTDESYLDSFKLDKEEAPSLYKMIEESVLEEEDQNWKQLGLIALELFFNTDDFYVQDKLKNTAAISFNKDLPTISDQTKQFLNSLLDKNFNRNNAQKAFIPFKKYIEKNSDLENFSEKLEYLQLKTNQEASSSSSKSAKKKLKKKI